MHFPNFRGRTRDPYRALPVTLVLLAVILPGACRADQDSLAAPEKPRSMAGTRSISPMPGNSGNLRFRDGVPADSNAEKPAAARLTRFQAMRVPGTGDFLLSFHFENPALGKPLRFRLNSAQGETVSELRLAGDLESPGIVQWPVVGANLSAGYFNLISEVDGQSQARPVVLGL